MGHASMEEEGGGVKHRPSCKIGGSSVRKGDMQQIFQQCAQIFLPLSTVQFTLSFSPWKCLKLPVTGNSALPPLPPPYPMDPRSLAPEMFLSGFLDLHYAVIRSLLEVAATFVVTVIVMLLLLLLARHQQTSSQLEQNTFTTTSDFSYVYGKGIKS